MLKQVSENTNKVIEQIDRCERFMSLVPEMRKSKTLDFDVVSRSANGIVFRCWFGRFQRDNEDCPAFDSEAIAEFIGCRPDEAMEMFGPNRSGGLTSRVAFMRAHIDWLYAKAAANQSEDL